MGWGEPAAAAPLDALKNPFLLRTLSQEWLAAIPRFG
jgi:hypothetical protein